ncbi:Ventricular zone-expressed PH domain-containing protein like protein 1 [Chelonia mydas]|uniref:Ventricular zone-expressed PH domain-containing protein like protein 1 n=1 Tax=Chelonia mydas TaxID=8469 RepID=M7B0M7_CHEMY|nr:Ventricular zone-expressed PH domain-containing protein like protein 1 [Chelonia mydas]
MEHSFHHILLLEIKDITDTFSNILGNQSRDIYRMSNSFTAIAKLLIRQLENYTTLGSRTENDAEEESPVQLDDLKSVMNENEEDEKLQVKIQAFEEKINVDNNTPGSVRRYSLGQVSKEERKDMRFNRSKSLALHAIRTKGMNSDNGQDMDNGDIAAGISFTEMYLSQENDKLRLSPDTEESQLENSSVSHPSIKCTELENLPESVEENCHEGSTETIKNPVEYQDKLYLHLKENLSKVKAYVMEIGKKIPSPDQCIIEAILCILQRPQAGSPRTPKTPFEVNVILCKECWIGLRGQSLGSSNVSFKGKLGIDLTSKSDWKCNAIQQKYENIITFCICCASYVAFAIHIQRIKFTTLKAEFALPDANITISYPGTFQGQSLGSSNVSFKGKLGIDLTSKSDWKCNAIQQKYENIITFCICCASYVAFAIHIQRTKFTTLKAEFALLDANITISYPGTFQNLFPEPLSIQSNTVQVLKTLWEKTQLKGTHGFETAMIQSTFPHQKDLDHVQMHLEEVRFFDLFGYSEEAGTWQCFMCNNPEKATVVNQDGQPLIEGKLKEKQVRWKFIKRWKTRYFTLAGNQLLFRKGKSKDDPDDCPIELSKVQSVKVVAKKRRDRSLPRAFEIFTNNKTYVFKAKDEKNAEEWLQCINVAVAQAKERESREATTYL